MHKVFHSISGLVVTIATALYSSLPGVQTAKRLHYRLFRKHDLPRLDPPPLLKPKKLSVYQLMMYQLRAGPSLSNYSTLNLPALRERILDEELPDVVLVHDPHGCVGRPSPKHGWAVPYYRVPTTQLQNPALPRRPRPDPSTARVAHLYIHPKNVLGEGMTSSVYLSPMALPGRERCAVAAKVPVSPEHLEEFEQEGKMYSLFPQELMEDTPAGPAVVPQFYGLYLPMLDDDALSQEQGKRESGPITEDVKDHHKGAPEPILLMEPCGGSSVADCTKITLAQRMQSLALLDRLHDAGFIFGHRKFPKNVVVQPGPLDAPPAQRTFDTPSFRIVDFAPTLSLDVERRGRPIDIHAEMRFKESCALEAERAREGLEKLKPGALPDDPRQAWALRVIRAGEARLIENALIMDNYAVKNGLVEA